MERPSHKELTTKIRQARIAVSNRRVEIVDPVAVAADALELGYLVAEMKSVLSRILDEFGPGHYAGRRPPQRSYKERIRGCELYAFRWESTLFGCPVYVKFALKEDTLWLASLHLHREENR
jgi:hypothetical protein